MLESPWQWRDRVCRNTPHRSIKLYAQSGDLQPWTYVRRSISHYTSQITNNCWSGHLQYVVLCFSYLHWVLLAMNGSVNLLATTSVTAGLAILACIWIHSRVYEKLYNDILAFSTCASLQQPHITCRRLEEARPDLLILLFELLLPPSFVLCSIISI